MTDPTPATPGARAATAAAAPDGPLSHRQIVTILIGLMMGMFLAALDQTIVATSIRTIADDLKGLDHQAWATTAYLITSTIVTPLYGKLGDIYGRKKLFVVAITVFVVGSVLCTFATSMGTLAFYRAVQGLGAGGLFSLALAIIGDIVPPRERAKYQGYFLAVFGTSSVLGPVIGGFFAGQGTILGISGWRWVFLVNVPIGIAALAVVTKTLHLRHTRLDHRIDWAGAALLTISLFVFHYVAYDTPLWQTMVVMVFFGLGLGFNFQPLTLAVQNAVPPQQIGVATATATFTRQIGGTLGTAVFLSILFSTASQKITTSLQAAVPTADFQAALADPANAAVAEQFAAAQAGGGAATGVLQDSSFLTGLDERLAKPFLIGFSEAMELVFLVGAGVMVFGFLIMLFLPNVELRKSSSYGQRANDDADAAVDAPVAAQR